jgi:hypothetical protein
VDKARQNGHCVREYWRQNLKESAPEFLGEIFPNKMKHVHITKQNINSVGPSFPQLNVSDH